MVTDAKAVYKTEALSQLTRRLDLGAASAAPGRLTNYSPPNVHDYDTTTTRGGGSWERCGGSGTGVVDGGRGWFDAEFNPDLRGGIR